MSSAGQPNRVRVWVILLFVGAAALGAIAAIRPVIITSALGSPQAIVVNVAIGLTLLGVALVLHRLRAPFALRLVLLGLPIVALLVWTVLPAFRSVRVDEALPGAPAAAAPAATPASDETTTPTAGAATTDRAQGTFSGRDGHDAQGVARLIEVDGATVLRLENFAVTNGPDLRVILTVAPSEGAAGGIDVGALKGNEGNQNYEVPADVDPSTIGAVLIWCRAFDVDFGVAPLQG